MDTFRLCKKQGEGGGKKREEEEEEGQTLKGARMEVKASLSGSGLVP